MTAYRKSFGVILTSSILLCLPFNMVADDIAAKSAIVSVTVYPDRATVLRETDLVLPAGTHAIVFDRLPASLIPNSLRVAGKGTAAVKILGLDAKTQFLEAPLLPEFHKLQAEVEALGFEVMMTRDAVEVLETQEKFLKSIEASKTSQEIPAWEKVVAFLGAKLQEIRLSRLAQIKLLREQENRFETLKKKMDSLKPQRGLEAKRVAVLVEATQAGKLTLSLGYTVMNARWTPLYTLRALPDSSEVELTVAANILQKSGENWEDTKAFLSTSSPSVGTYPPDLPPWFLDIFIPRPEYPQELRKKEVIGGVVGGVMGGIVSDRAEAAAAAPAIPREAEMAEAGVVESGIHLSFEIKRKVDVLSDGTPHKVPIDSQRMKTRIDYFTVPKMRQAAFLRGSMKNTLPYPLLRGQADLFIIQDFVGSVELPYVAPEEEAKFFFGEDRQVSVKHEQVKREKSGPSFMGKTEKLRLVRRITIQNFRRNAVEVEVLDQLPVSQNAKIEIKDISINPAPAKKDEKGLLTWTVMLGPQEKKEILVDFTVEYPKDARIIGL